MAILTANNELTNYEFYGDLQDKIVQKYWSEYNGWIDTSECLCLEYPLKTVKGEQINNQKGLEEYLLLEEYVQDKIVLEFILFN